MQAMRPPAPRASCANTLLLALCPSASFSSVNSIVKPDLTVRSSLLWLAQLREPGRFEEDLFPGDTGQALACHQGAAWHGEHDALNHAQ